MTRLKTPWFTGLLALSLPFSLLGATSLASIAQADDSVEGSLYANVDGPLSIDLVKSAKSTLDIEIYTLSDPTLIQELIRAANRGVKIQVVKDPTPVGGEACRWFASLEERANDTAPTSVDCSSTDNLISAIESNGGKVVPFDKAAQCGKGTGDGSAVAGAFAPNCFEHGKIMLIDGASAWMSTGNLDSTNLCLPDGSEAKCNRDFAWKITDKAILGSLVKVFNHDLADSRDDLGAMIDSGEIDSRLTVSPYGRTALTDFIDSAKTSIDVQNQYLKDEGMNAALLRAAKRGVKVRVEVASFCAFGKPSSGDRKKATATYGSFDDAGIESRAFSGAIQIGGRPGYLHAKYMVVDGNRGWLGSINGSKTAIDLNREFGVFFTNDDAVSKLNGLFESDFTADGAETWEESLACAKDLH